MREDRQDPLAVPRAIARWMDNRLLDPLLGLVLPGAGDLIGAVLGVWSVGVAWRLGASKVVVARMIFNLAVDAAAGAVPLIGDLWDFFFRAHRRNLDLLAARVDEGDLRARPGDWAVVVAAALLFLAALAAPVVVLLAAVDALRG